ncbi:hypothetical protein [Flexibacter flexilis]|uniref:hypothetical protein n=1 Tax=Flexibacter flexilis TaxID=998 RepID=UPI0011609E02|nr:hypothetical protein [Flexibacter flexilis]
MSELAAILATPNTAIKVRESVRFKGLILGASVHDVIETLGVPEHITHQREGRTIYEIFWYTEHFAGQSVTMQVHIIDDLFVAGTYFLAETQSHLLDSLVPNQEFDAAKVISDVYNNMIYVRSKAECIAVWFVTGDVRLRRRAEVPTSPLSFREVVGTLSSFLL